MRIGHVSRSSFSWQFASYLALWFNAFWAFMGAWYLLAGARNMPVSYLDGSPFTDYTGPGFILLFIVGGSSLIAALARWRHTHYAFELTIIAGAILLGWLAFEFFWIPQAWVPQLIFAGVAAVMLVGGYAGWHETPRTPVKS